MLERDRRARTFAIDERAAECRGELRRVAFSTVVISRGTAGEYCVPVLGNGSTTAGASDDSEIKIGEGDDRGFVLAC